MPVKFDMAAVKPTIMSLLLLGVELVVVINFLKFVAAKWPVPGISDLILAM